MTTDCPKCQVRATQNCPKCHMLMPVCKKCFHQNPSAHICPEKPSQDELIERNDKNQFIIRTLHDDHGELIKICQEQQDEIKKLTAEALEKSRKIHGYEVELKKMRDEAMRISVLPPTPCSSPVDSPTERPNNLAADDPPALLPTKEKIANIKKTIKKTGTVKTTRPQKKKSVKKKPVKSEPSEE